MLSLREKLLAEAEFAYQQLHTIPIDLAVALMDVGVIVEELIRKWDKNYSPMR